MLFASELFSPVLSLSNLFRLFFTGEFSVCQLLSHDTMHRSKEPIGNITKSLIEAERLFVQIAKHMKRLNTNVGAFDAALQERPKFSIPFV